MDMNRKHIQMTQLLACTDGSRYADSVCHYVSWFSNKLSVGADLLHVLRRHSDYESASNLSGAIGLGARSELLEELTRVDEERGKLDQEKGKLILKHAQSVIEEAGVSPVNTLHRRGSLVKVIQELEERYEMVFIGKRGEHANMGSTILGSNLEKVARGVSKPLFLASETIRPLKKILLAYDGKSSTLKAIDFFVKHSAFNELECHLISVDSSGDIDLSGPEDQLKQAGYSVSAQSIQSDASVESVISSYVSEHEIDLLAIGAYSHSPLRQFLLGSTTASLIVQCHIPLLLFR